MVGKAVNTLMKVIHSIDEDNNKVKIEPWKKKHNIDVLKYIKEGKHPEKEVGKYVYDIK